MQTLEEGGKKVLGAGKNVYLTGRQAIANPKGAVRQAKKNLGAMKDKTTSSWKEAVQRRNERVYGGYENPQQQKEAEEKERIAERQKKIEERMEVRQTNQRLGRNKPRQYTDPETGEVKDMARNYADTGIEDYDITSSGDDDQRFFQFKDASNQLGIDWSKYKSQAGYRSKIQNDLKNKYNITADEITRFQDKVGQGSFSGKKIKPRQIGEEERRNLIADRLEGGAISSSRLNNPTSIKPPETAASRENSKKERKRRESMQKQDRRDDPALWESWDGGL